MSISSRSILFVITVLSMVFLSGTSSAGHSALAGEVQLANNNWEIAKAEDGETILPVEGAFMVTEKSGLDIIGEVTATISVSTGQWQAEPRQVVYNDIPVDAWQTFVIDVTIPEDESPGMTSSYSISIYLEGQVSEETLTQGFVVTLMSESGDDDDTDPDDNGASNDNDGEGGSSFPIWPLFVLGLIVLLVFVIIWAYRNIEVVREVDGRRKLYLREKDTGRIFGKDR
jgi:hypothetical protein